MSYQAAESKAVDAIKKAIPASMKRNMLPESKGLFAELYETDIIPDHYLATAIDGVGTKLILAEAMHKFDTVGIDLVAMSANDLATLGAVSPFIFMDYLACQSKIQEEKITGNIIKGIVKGLEQADASKALRNSIKLNFGKGETASVSELIAATREGYGFDLAGCMIGFITKEKFKAQKVADGDQIIALPSSGFHSNGYTDLRYHLLNGDFESRKEFKKRYKGKHSLHDTFEDTTIGEALLEPTKIYTKEIAAAAKNFDFIGINNTGYGLKNFNRLAGFRFTINNPLPVPSLAALMQQQSKFSDEQMYTTFNMGMGFFVIARKQDTENILQHLKDAKVVGTVQKGKTATVLENGSKMVLEGY